MRQYAIAGLLLASLTVPALAATAMPSSGETSSNDSFAAKDHWAVMDTVGNCAVLDSQPSILGDKSGYSSLSVDQTNGRKPIQLKNSKTTISTTIVSGLFLNFGPTHVDRPLKIKSASARIGKRSAPVTAYAN